MAEEADEACYRMGLTIDGGLPRNEQVATRRLEGCELTAIMAASRISAAGAKIANRKSKI